MKFLLLMKFLGSSCNYMKYCTFVFLQSDPKSLCFCNIAQKLRLLHFGPKVVVIAQKFLIAFCPKVVVIACWPKLDENKIVLSL